MHSIIQVTLRNQVTQVNGEHVRIHCRNLVTVNPWIRGAGHYQIFLILWKPFLRNCISDTRCCFLTFFLCECVSEQTDTNLSKFYKQSNVQQLKATYLDS